MCVPLVPFFDFTETNEGHFKFGQNTNTFKYMTAKKEKKKTIIIAQNIRTDRYSSQQ